MCIVHSNHCNVIVGVFVVLSISVGLSNGPQFPFLFISYVISRRVLGGAPVVKHCYK